MPPGPLLLGQFGQYARPFWRPSERPSDRLQNHSDNSPRKLDKDRERAPGSDETEKRPSDDISSVPDPVPDTGIYTSDETHEHHTTLLASSATATVSLSTSQISASPIFLSSSSMPTIAASTFSLSQLGVIPAATGIVVAPPHIVPGHSSVSPHHHISVAIIVLSALGAAFLLLGIVIVTRGCCRPRHRVHPKPSLPILKDGLDDQDLYCVDGSPVFGGMERISRPGSNGLWTWTQYSQPSFVVTRPAPTAGADSDRAASGLCVLDKGVEPDQSRIGANYYPFVGYGNNPAITPANSFQDVRNATGLAAPRLSTASVSLYPNSPLDEKSVGVAIGDVPSSSLRNHPSIKNTRTENGENGGPGVMKKDRNSVQKRYSLGSPYDGADVSSPTNVIVAPAPAATASGGRSRIKSSYYTPGAYRRMSGVPPPLSLVTSSTKTNINGATPVSPQHTLHKSNSRRDRDTRALTSVLGLEMPHLPGSCSPHPTLYPDDSLSVAESPGLGDNLDGAHDRSAPKLEFATQEGIFESRTEAHVSLGNLMLSGFTPTSKSLASVSGRDGLAQPASLNITKKTYRTDDKPPRVPSPPPLPSLAQMALALANPEAYANYRSPTYSIYRGLCEDHGISSL